MLASDAKEHASTIDTPLAENESSDQENVPAIQHAKEVDIVSFQRSACHFMSFKLLIQFHLIYHAIMVRTEPCADCS